MFLGIFRCFVVISRPVLAALFIFFCTFMCNETCYSSVRRSQPNVGIIASATGDAQILFVEETDWKQAFAEQGLIAGDGLRTGSLGAMALLFNDRTQNLKIHRLFWWGSMNQVSGNLRCSGPGIENFMVY